MSTLPESVSLRAATPDDENFLFELFAITRMDEFRFLDADEKQREALIRMQYEMRRFQYDQSYPNSESGIILFRDRAVGRMLIDESEHEITLIDIALLPEDRNAGIGTCLVQRLLTRATDAGKAVRLHVVRSNPACRLYERLGFSSVRDDGLYFEMLCLPRVDRKSERFR